MRGHEHLRDLERVGHLGGVQRACTAEGDQRELARVVPLLDRPRADRARHVRVRDREDPLRRLEQAQAEPVGELLDGLDGGVTVELHPAAEEAVGVEPAEDDVRVADRRLLSPVAVAGGAGRGAGAARADAEGATFVDVRDRAAAGADRVHVEHRHEQRIAADPGVAGRRLADAVLGDDADVGGGAAHVERDQTPPSGERAGPLTAEDPGGRAGEQERHGTLGGRVHARDAAARHHHVQLAFDALRLERCRRAGRGSCPSSGRRKRSSSRS